MIDNNDEELDYRDYEDPFVEEVGDAKCPECGESKVVRIARQSSPDDYVWQYECRNCGATWED